MARPRRPPTRMVRIRKSDLARLKLMAKSAGLPLPDLISKLARRKYAKLNF